MQLTRSFLEGRERFLHALLEGQQRPAVPGPAGSASAPEVGSNPMSRNLVELVRRTHARRRADGARGAQGGDRGPRRDHRRGPPRARRRRRGCRRRRSTASRPSTTTCSLPRGRAPRARLHRDRVLRGDRRRARRRARARRFGLRARRAPRRRLAVARRDRLPRLLPLLPGGPRRRRRSTPAPDVVERVLAGATRAGAGAGVAQRARRAGADASPATGRGSSARSPSTTPESLLEEVKAAKVRGRGGAGFPAGDKWRLRARLAGRAEVHRRQRRRGRPGLLHRQVPDGAQPGARARGHGARRVRGRRRRTASC